MTKGSVQFTNLAELNAALQTWWMEYNTERPHQYLRYKTPNNYEISNKNFYFKVVAA